MACYEPYSKILSEGLKVITCPCVGDHPKTGFKMYYVFAN